MKALVGVVLIAFLTLASGQNRQLRCFDCADCHEVNPATTPQRLCYSLMTPPTLQTVPATIPLTPPTTPSPPLVPNPPPAGIPNQPQHELEPIQLENSISQARNNPLHTCFMIRRHIGDREIISRGCTLLHRTHELTCKEENDGEMPDYCDLCSENDCNDRSDVTKVFASISLLFASLLIALRLH